MSRAYAPVVVLIAVGCGGKQEPDTTDSVGPTWYADVQPIVREHCSGCHQDGSIAPMALDDYASAQPWADVMAQSATERTMPPWLLTSDGSCQSFQHSRWLPDEDIATLQAWADAGAPPGRPSDADETPIPDPPALDRVDLVASTPNFTPVAAGTAYSMSDEYRCFLVDDPTDADLFVTGFEVAPGNAAIVHHVLLMPVEPEGTAWDGRTNAVNLAELDAQDPEIGWDCYGAAGGNVRERNMPVVWAPGMGAVEFPGVGMPVKADDVFVIQVHYNLADPAHVGESDQTTVSLRTEASVDRQGYYALPDLFLGSLFYGTPESIPPGDPGYTYTFELSGSDTIASSGAPRPAWDQPFELLGVMPHMHQRGVRQSFTVTHADGTEECLAEVRDWDFNWQLQYFYEQPITIQPDDTLRVSCTWDSTAESAPVYPGWGTANEMCLVSMLLTP
jgi:hypothetical protein